MYAVFHPDLVIKPWHVYVAFILVTWFCCAVVVFANRVLPFLNNIGLFLIIGGGLITIIVVAAMPKVHANNSAVWGDFDTNNASGWTPGVAFLTGVLNGAFTIGTPDAVTHMSEELPNPARDMPRAVAAQIILGTLSSSHSDIFDIIANSLSFFLLRYRNSIRHHGPIRCNKQQWILPSRCRLLPGYRQQGRHLWLALDHISVYHDMCHGNFSHSTCSHIRARVVINPDIPRSVAYYGLWREIMQHPFPVSSPRSTKSLAVRFLQQSFVV